MTKTDTHDQGAVVPLGPAHRVWPGLACVALCVLMLGCNRTVSSGASVSASGASPSGANLPPVDPPAAPASKRGSAGSRPAASTDYRLLAAKRVVAIGDLHGDWEATLGVLRLVGALDANNQWSGGDLTVVQTGDQLDRGDGERQILDLIARLEKQAPNTGGRFIALNGNHEVMNVMGDFRYVTALGAQAFADVTSPALPVQIASQLPAAVRGRATAFFPGGSYALQLAQRSIVVQVGDTVFVHGGVLDKHVSYGIDRINREASEWMRGVRPQPQILSAEDAPIWTRLYSDSDTQGCAALQQVLARMGAKRMVVGHTIQQSGISSACNERVWRIDIGMSAHYGGHSLAALELTDQGVRVLATPKSVVIPAAAE